MRYYRNVDYFIYFEDFPHMGIPGVIVANSDGTANIYINTLYNAERQDKTIRHELRHLAKEHLYCDHMTIEEKEAEADNFKDLSCSFADNFEYVEIEDLPCLQPAWSKDRTARQIPLFYSLEALGRFAQRIHEDAAAHKKAAGGQ